MCTADLIVQRAPVKSHASQGLVARAVRLVENQYRTVLFDAQERTRVEIDPISAASAWIPRQQVSATHRKSNIIRTSDWKSIKISDSPVVRDGRVCGAIRSKTWRSSRGCERNTTNDTRTVVTTLSNSLQLFLTSSLTVTTWKFKRDGLHLPTSPLLPSSSSSHHHTHPPPLLPRFLFSPLHSLLPTTTTHHQSSVVQG